MSWAIYSLRCMNYKRYLLVGLLFYLFIGCDTSRSINPFEENLGSFSVYGAIELDEENNFIRIRDVSIPFLADSGAGYEFVTARLEELSTGREISLKDSIINFNGNYTLNYLIEEPLQPRVAYNFTVADSSGESVNSVFTMPGVNTHRINQNMVQNCWQPIRFTWDNVIAPEYILAFAGVNYQGRRYWGEVQRVDEPDHVPGENRMEMVLTVRQLLVDIFPPPIGGEGATSVPVEFWPPEVECTELDNNEVYIRYIHFGSDWVQFEETDYYIFDFLDSGEIENGIGFLGGIRRDEYMFEVQILN